LSSSLISVFLERDVRGILGMIAASGAKREDDDADEEQEQREQAPAVGEVAQIVVVHCRSSSAPSGHLVVGREVDQRAEHLQIGHQRVHLADAAGLPSNAPITALG
jgi:hypothetical protein